MPVVTIQEAKTQLSPLIERVERGEEVIIVRDKTPVARLVPTPQSSPSVASAR